MIVNLNNMSKEEEYEIWEMTDRKVRPKTPTIGSVCYGELTVVSASEQRAWTVFTDISKRDWDRCPTGLYEGYKGSPVLFIKEYRRPNEADDGPLRLWEWTFVRTISQESEINGWMTDLKFFREALD
jgi:hypothetical protein